MCVGYSDSVTCLGLCPPLNCYGDCHHGQVPGIYFPNIAIGYAMFGKYIPGTWGHNGITFRNLLTTLVYSDRGVWGSITGTSATIIATFVIFGSVLFSTGGGQTFIDAANALTGRATGGAAKLATISSALFGTVSGSAGANVATTGAFTIPMMKRLGYKKEFAAAVECSASSGGQIMPPVMGAGAFIMADLLGMPYLGIAAAAVLPAVMYYLGVFVAIDCAARRYHYKGLAEEDMVSLREVFYYKKSLPVFLPILLLIVFFISGYTAVTCASYALIAAIILFLAVEPKECKQRLHMLFDGFIASAKSMLTTLSLIACAQILVCLISVTGIGVKFSGLIMEIGGGHMFLAGLMAMIATMILGMGMPTVAAYVLAASVIAPALVRVGVVPVAAHFFVFYYAIFAGLTPPVCGTVFIGAAMAESNWLKTAWDAIRISIGVCCSFYVSLFPCIIVGWLYSRNYSLFGNLLCGHGRVGWWRNGIPRPHIENVGANYLSCNRTPTNRPHGCNGYYRRCRNGFGNYLSESKS